MKDKQQKLYEEHLRKIKFGFNYKINESPKYRPLVDVGDEFDDIPLKEVGDQEDAIKPDGGQMPPAPSNDQPVSAEPPVPEFDQAGGAPAPESGVPAPEGGVPPVDAPVGVQPPMGNEPITPQVDDIQNEIIKHNLEAMKSIHDQLMSLNDMTLSLNNKLSELSADVEEVREPSNTEKLMGKSNVSHPYYYNLNDFWSGNWFNEQREKENSKGIRELPDGTFIADFDDLPVKSKTDINNSFN